MDLVVATKWFGRMMHSSHFCHDSVQIPQRMVIPGLRDSLTKILHDFELQLQMQAGCRSVMLDSTDELLRRYLSNCARPALIDSEATCILCR